MKSPETLANKLKNQWQNAALRESLLLDQMEWPVRLTIGRPSASVLASDWPTVKQHILAWQRVGVGRVTWEERAYRATGDPVKIPLAWELDSLSDWIVAAGSNDVESECRQLERILAASDPLFHSFFIRQRAAWGGKPIEEILKVAELCAALTPGCAQGLPLRSFPFPGIDSKFFERNRNLIVRLLDLRYDDEVSVQGLEVFLDAVSEKDHWMLLTDLDGGLLPFVQSRVRNVDLLNATLPACNLLVVENERCLHLLPKPLPGTLVVLGAGRNLNWLRAPWVQGCRVAYWGDIDTWGLRLLARARRQVPHVAPLLMDRATYGAHADKHAMPEPTHAGTTPPEGLTAKEEELYVWLLTQVNGRLEQEYISAESAESAICEWAEEG